AAVDAHVLEDGAGGRMLDLLVILHQLDARVDDAVLVLEERRQAPHADVAIFVDRHAQHGAAVLAIPGRVIRTSAEQRNAEGGAADDHATSREGCGSRAMAWARMAPAAARDSGVPI